MTPQSQLPKTLDPIKLAKHNAHYQGQLQLRHCPRLQELFDQHDQTANVELRFGIDQANFNFVEGRVTGTIQLACQRCNAPMQETIDITFSLTPVTPKSLEKNLPEKYEPLIMEGESILTIDMIEEEILLALPMIPKHVDCSL